MRHYFFKPGSRSLQPIIPTYVFAAALATLSSCAQQEVTNAPSQQTSQSGKDGASNASADQLNDVRILLKGESLPDCTQSLFGRVYYLPESKNFKACSADGWNALEMKGEQGIAGDKGERGAAGDKGERGATGDKGDTGARGNDGFSSLATIASEPAGINCQLGGRAFKLGLDKNRNNILDSNEVTSTSYFCTTIACAPDQPLGNAECKTEIANSLNASKPKSCNRTGDGFTFGGCVASSCAQGFYLDNNTCKAQTCSPGISIGNVDCSSEAANSKVATKTQTCNVTGNGYTFGACTIAGCASGYYLSGGKCLAQTCQPNQSYGSVDCKSEISYSSAASKTKTCNGSGSDYLFGLCKATSCATGYYLDNNSCVAQKCSPNQTLGDVDCKTEIPFAAEASKARSCNSIGNDFTYGACNLKSCGIGYFKSGNSCVAQKCTPNQKLANVSCTSEITNSLTAEKTRTCNSDGSDVIYGSCQALSCPADFELFAGTCRIKDPGEPIATSYGWYDVSQDQYGRFSGCKTSDIKNCALKYKDSPLVFTGYDGQARSGSAADTYCKSLGYRLPTNEELAAAAAKGITYSIDTVFGSFRNNLLDGIWSGTQISAGYYYAFGLRNGGAYKPYLSYKDQPFDFICVGSGYDLPPRKTTSPPKTLPEQIEPAPNANGWVDMTVDSAGKLVPCSQDRLVDCAYRHVDSNITFTGFSKLPRYWTDAKSFCESKGHRLPTRDELFFAYHRNIKESVTPLKGLDIFGNIYWTNLAGLYSTGLPRGDYGFMPLYSGEYTSALIQLRDGFQIAMGSICVKTSANTSVPAAGSCRIGDGNSIEDGQCIPLAIDLVSISSTYTQGIPVFVSDSTRVLALTSYANVSWKIYGGTNLKKIILYGAGTTSVSHSTSASVTFICGSSSGGCKNGYLNIFNGSDNGNKCNNWYYPGVADSASSRDCLVNFLKTGVFGVDNLKIRAETGAYNATNSGFRLP